MIGPIFRFAALQCGKSNPQVRIPGAIPPENVKLFTENVWVRLGFDPNDKTTWTKEMVRVLIDLQSK
jgi:hypothetical protein